MEKKKSIMGNFWHGFWHLPELMPTKINIYSNEKEGIEAFEIEQPENMFVPTHIRCFEDKKKGIFKFSMHNKKSVNKKNTELIENDEER